MIYIASSIISHFILTYHGIHAKKLLKLLTKYHYEVLQQPWRSLTQLLKECAGHFCVVTFSDFQKV